MKFIALFILMIFPRMMFSTGNPLPGTSTVKGTIEELGTSELLSGVRVTVKGTDIIAYSDRNGAFELSNVPVGSIELLFTLVSFETTSIELVPSSGQVADVSVELRSR